MSRDCFVCMIAYTDYVFDARVRREARTLASQGFKVRCLTPTNGTGHRHFEIDNVEVRELHVRKYRGKSTVAYVLSYVHFLLSCSVVCLSLRLKRELDIVHAHNLPDFLVFAGLLPRLMGSRVVLDIHDSVPETFATKFSSSSMLWKALCLEERVSAMVAHKVICVNHPQRDTLVARGVPSAKAFVSMNIPDPKIFNRTTVDGRSAMVGGPFNVVYHGTMSERLGVDLVIRAVGLLRERVPVVQLHLWGKGDDLVAFQKLVRELKLEQTVFFIPEGIPLPELPQHLAAMQVGVVGNRRTVAGELMLPVKLVEYVSLGIPAVVPRLNTITYYFPEDMVTYFTPDDPESLRDALHVLYSDPDLRQRQAQRAQDFLKEYGWDRQGPELVRFYQGLIPGLSSLHDSPAEAEI